MSEKTSEELLKGDFRLFLWVLWQHLRLPEPTPRQYAIAWYLQHGPRRRMVQAFRGVGKSWITAAFVLWKLFCNPDERVMVVSANEDRAIQFATFVRRLIEEVDILQHLRPRDGQRDSVLAFDVGPSSAHQAPSVKAVGITGQLAGSRATLIVSDDVEIPKNAATEIQREKLAELVKEYDAVLIPGGDIVYLGTPQTYHSIYRRLRERGYEIRIWPARYPTLKELEGYEGCLAPDVLRELQRDPTVAGKSTEPARFSDLDLAERETSYGRSGFSLQFMLDTSLSDANRFPLKTSDLIIFDCDREVAPVKLTWASDPRNACELANVGFPGDRLYRPMYVSNDVAKYEGTIMVIDPSGRGADETAYCVARLHKGMVFVVAWGGLEGGYDAPTLKRLAEIAKEHAVNKIWPESNFGDGMFTSLLQPWLTAIYPCTVEEFRVSGQKEARIIDKLEPAFNQHRVVFDRKVLEEDLKADDLRFSGLYQLTHITRDRGALRHDDRLDVLAEAVGHFTESLARDTRRIEEETRQRLRDEEYKRFRGGLLSLTNGLPPTSPKPAHWRRASVLKRR